MDAQEQDTWDILRQYPAVFGTVLRVTGPWDQDDRHDVVTDFAFKLLPRALRSFRVTRGDMRCWLYSVFFHHVLRWRLQNPSMAASWVSLEDLDDPPAAPECGDFLPDTDRLVEAALKQLPWEQSKFLFSACECDSEPLSKREIARRFRMCRKKAMQELSHSLFALAWRVKKEGILSDEELNCCQTYANSNGDLKAFASHYETGSEEALQLLRGALTILLGSVARISLVNAPEQQDRQE